MKRKAVIIICAVFLFIVPVYADNSNTIVYRTKSGECYHTEKDTNALSDSKIPLTLKEAVDQGLRPCGNCHPPELDYENPKPIPTRSYTLVPDYTDNSKSIIERNNEAIADLRNHYQNGRFITTNPTPIPTSTPLPTIIPDVPEVEPEQTDNNIWGTVALSAAVGAGVSVLIGNKKR